MRNKHTKKLNEYQKKTPFKNPLCVLRLVGSAHDALHDGPQVSALTGRGVEGRRDWETQIVKPPL